MALAYKFYFATFKNKKFELIESYRYCKWGDEKFLCKFGITHNNDAAKRFDPSVNDSYQKSEKYLDWDISIDFSRSFDTKEEAEAYERYWLEEEYPKTGYTKVWVEKALGCPTMDYYTEATGVSELRLLTKRQRRRTLKIMYEERDKANAESV